MHKYGFLFLYRVTYLTFAMEPAGNYNKDKKSSGGFYEEK